MGEVSRALMWRLFFAVVAFTGGNGPALTAYLLNNLFEGGVVGCIGDTTRLPRRQVEHASFVADLLGAPPPPCKCIVTNLCYKQKLA
jgi:hypothetical protein